MQNEIAIRQETNPMLAMGKESMEMAKMLSQSTIVPTHFQKNPANCWIALQFSARSGADPFMIMQSMYIVHNKPALETKLLVALFNNSGRFDPIEYIFNKSKTECTARSRIKATGQIIEGATISIEMAKAEGWYQKNGSKWKTMPELMLSYRAAAFLIRRHAPEVTFGMPTVDEEYDIQENNGVYDLNVQKEIEQHANKKQLDFEQEPVKDEIPATTLNKIKKMMALEKNANRNKNQTLESLSGFLNRKIERLREVSETELDNYIDAIQMELNPDEKPDWMNE